MFSILGSNSPNSPDATQSIDDKEQIEHFHEEIENLKSRICSKDSSISHLKTKLETKEMEIGQYKSQIEKLNRSMKDLTQSQKMSILANEEKIAKRTKELETILKDKKCRNCPICLDGMNHSFKD